MTSFVYRLNLTKKIYLYISTWRRDKGRPFYFLISQSPLTPLSVQVILGKREFWFMINTRGVNGH